MKNTKIFFTTILLMVVTMAMAMTNVNMNATENNIEDTAFKDKTTIAFPNIEPVATDIPTIPPIEEEAESTDPGYFEEKSNDAETSTQGTPDLKGTETIDPRKTAAVYGNKVTTSMTLTTETYIKSVYAAALMSNDVILKNDGTMVKAYTLADTYQNKTTRKRNHDVSTEGNMVMKNPVMIENTASQNSYGSTQYDTMTQGKSKDAAAKNTTAADINKTIANVWNNNLTLESNLMIQANLNWKNVAIG